MKKISTLCLALAMACAGSVGASAATPQKMAGHRTSQWSVSLPGMRTQKSSELRFSQMGLGSTSVAPRAVNDDPVGTASAPGFGWVVGPDGSQWYYTQEFETSGYYYTGSTITLFDSNNAQAGQFTVDIPDTLTVNSIELYGAVTKKMFDKDDSSSEAMVSIHAVGNASNNYQGLYLTRAYHIDGSGVAYECEGSGMFFDASKGWNTYQRLIVPTVKTIGDKEYISIDFVAPPTWGKDTPYVENTMTIDYDNINYMDGAYINCFIVDDQPYYVIAQYDTAYCTMPEDYTQDIIVTPNNHFILKTYNRRFALVDSVSIPVDEAAGDASYRMAAFGRMSDYDLSKGYFGDSDNFSYVVTWVDYHTSSDDNTYDFDVYDHEGNKIKTVCQNAAENEWFYLNDIKGKSQQMAFLQAVGDGQQVQMVDVPACENKTLFPAEIDGEGITTAIDRYPSDKNEEGYQYVVSMRNAASDEEDNVIARLGWYNPDLTFDHFVNINLGQQGEYFTPLINSTSLNPYLFDTDDEMEYIYIAKKRRTDGSNVIDNVLEIAKEDGTVMRSFRGDDEKAFRTASVVSMDDSKNELFVAYYSDDTQQYDLNFYALPLVKFAQGGDGSKSDPYLISTVGDMKYMATEPAAAYRMVADIDMSTYNYDWTPVPTFSGSLDGDGHHVANLSIASTDSHAGLFGTIDENASVKDIVFVDPTMTFTSDNQFAGFVAGEAVQDSISGIHVFGASVEGGDNDVTFGGILGAASLYSSVSDCSFHGTVNAPSANRVGGIVGKTATSTNVKACASDADLTGASAVGGIVGSVSSNDSIFDCHAGGNLTAENTIGGIAGESMRGPIVKCLFDGTVNATEASWNGLSAGGIVGNLSSDWSDEQSEAITGCVSTGTVNADATDATVHAIVGWTIANEYYGEDETPWTEGGLSSNYSTSAPETSKDTDVDGAPVAASALNTDFFTTLGYAYGQTTKAPWKETAAAPVLYFEKVALALTLSDDALLMDNGDTQNIVATVYGADASAIEVESDNRSAVTVEVTTTKDGAATILIKAHSDGVAHVTVTAGDLSAVCTVTVDHVATGIGDAETAAKPVIAVDGNAISAQGATALTVYTIDGHKIAQSAGTACTLTKGIYVVKASDAAGHTATAKVVVK